MYEMIEDSARRYPGNIAYEFMGKKTDYRTFLARIQATAKALWAFGIRKGDRVTIAMPNSPQAVDAFYALNRIGAIPTMIHPLSAPGEIAFYLNASKSKAILTLDQFYPKVEEILPALEHPVKIIIARIRDELKAPLRYAFIMTKGRKLPKLPKSDKYTFWNDFMDAGAAQDTQLPPIDGKARRRGNPLPAAPPAPPRASCSQPQLQRPGFADRGHERLYRPARHEDALGDAHFPRLRPGHRHPHGAGGGRDLHPRAAVHHQHLRQTAEKKSPTSSPAFRRCLRRFCAPTSWKTPT